MNEIDKLYEEYFHFEETMIFVEENENRKRRLSFASKIQSMIDQFPDSSKLYFILGECLYNLPYWEDRDKQLIESAFFRADLLESNVLISKIYLTYFYYDIGQYALSLKVNSLINQNLLDNENSRWRMIKLMELEICCLILLNKRKLEKKFKSFFNQIEKLESCELEDVEPIQLKEILKNGDCSIDYLHNALKRINSIWP